MNILVVVAYFVPEIGSAAHVYYDLSKEFVRQGHTVHVITSYPREYNLSEDNRNKSFPMDEVLDGMHVHRVRYEADRDNILSRGMEHFILSRRYYQRFRSLGEKFDACLFYLPPLPLYRLANKIRKKTGAICVLNFQDFHPQELTDIGVLKNPLMIKFMERLERKAYSGKNEIVVISSGGVDYILDRGGRKEAVHHIFNGISLQDADKLLTKRDFKRKERIEDKFLVSYAGILSPFQGLDIILDGAKRVEQNNNILFYIVGDGMEREHLEARVKNENIKNVRILGLQSRDEYYNIISSSDLSIVALDERMEAPCIPGKLLNLMAAGQPIVATVPDNCETANLIREANMGVAVTPCNGNKFSEVIQELYVNEEERLAFSHNGRQFAEQKLNLPIIANSYISLFLRCQ